MPKPDPYIKTADEHALLWQESIEKYAPITLPAEYAPRSRAAHIKCYDQQEFLEIVDRHYSRTMAFSMNDEIIHTGFSKLAWYYFIIAFYPKGGGR